MIKGRIVSTYVKTSFSVGVNFYVRQNNEQVQSERKAISYNITGYKGQENEEEKLL